MNLRSGQISIILATLLVSGCYKPPEFSEIPVIRFERLLFIQSASSGDSLNLTFEIEDGDGDVGLEDNERYPPYQSYDSVIDSRNTVVKLRSTNIVPPLYKVNRYGERSFFSETDNRPSEYTCESYRVLSYDDRTYDTIYIVPNEYRNNIYIDFLVRNRGEYQLVTSLDNCGVSGFSARFPIFDEGNIGRSLNGSITYAMLSGGFPIALNNDTFKIRFYIYDRALNRSNVAESPDLTLPDITRTVD